MNRRPIPFLSLPLAVAVLTATAVTGASPSPPPPRATAAFSHFRTVAGDDRRCRGVGTVGTAFLAPVRRAAEASRHVGFAALSATDDAGGAAGSNDDIDTDIEAAASVPAIPDLTDGDRAAVRAVFAAAGGDDKAMEGSVTSALDGGMHPRLVVALQRKANDADAEEDEREEEDEEFEAQFVAVAGALKRVLDGRLGGGRELLATFLDAGEIRKLDSAIGKAARDGGLDMGFFSVLDMNLRDAAYEQKQEAQRTSSGGVGEAAVEIEEEEEGTNRAQILQHIYTRCQEELEKNVPPGPALLHKLLRTEISSIRSNQLSHYMGPQATSITSPDGKVIELAGTAKPMVSVPQFVGALAAAVVQIRTLERAGGTDRMTAANLVENVRRVAMESRTAMVEAYGEDSEEVKELQDGLQPVFRPSSAQSEYVRGS